MLPATDRSCSHTWQTYSKVFPSPRTGPSLPAPVPPGYSLSSPHPPSQTPPNVGEVGMGVQVAWMEAPDRMAAPQVQGIRYNIYPG